MEKQISSTKLYPAGMCYPREAPAQLQGSHCTGCGTTVFPASERCLACVSGNVGRIPVNASGGLLSKGHPVGATGAAQIVEIVRQLQGRCGPRQVEGAKVGLAHVTGGGIYGFDHGACAIHVFAR